MILEAEEFEKFMEAFRSRALEAGIDKDVVKNIMASVPKVPEIKLNTLYRSIIIEAIGYGVLEDVITTVLAEATNDRENAIAKTVEEVSEHQLVYGPPQRERVEVVSNPQLVYGPPQREIVEGVSRRQLVYGPPQGERVEVVVNRQTLYGPAQPTGRKR